MSRRVYIYKITTWLKINCRGVRILFVSLLDLQSEFANKNCLEESWFIRAINARHYRSVACHAVGTCSRPRQHIVA